MRGAVPPTIFRTAASKEGTLALKDREPTLRHLISSAELHLLLLLLQCEPAAESVSVGSCPGLARAQPALQVARSGRRDRQDLRVSPGLLGFLGLLSRSLRQYWGCLRSWRRFRRISSRSSPRSTRSSPLSTRSWRR
jgi:hypothetical protein